MLSFILGAPNSGKTKEITNRITEDLKCGNKVLLLVPEQEAISAERRILDSHNTSSDYFLLDVANFSRLSNIVYRALGGLCYNYIDKGGQAVIMWRVLSELSASLNTYKTGSSTDIDLISSLLQLFSEFADYQVSPIALEDAAVKLNGILKAKSEDIATIYMRYDELVHSDFDSSKDDLEKVSELILENRFFNDTKIYIDSFSGFTPAELKVIEAMLSVGADVTISLCIDMNRDTGIFENLIDFKNYITEYAHNNKIEVAQEYHTYSSRDGEFAFFAKHAFDSLSKENYGTTTENILYVEAPDIYTECELICADIAKHLRTGYRYRDFCIVAGDAKKYFGILDVILQRHNIPCRFSISRDILQSPCVKFIISALNIIIYNWRLSDIISYIKTGLSGITDEECDIIEEYASTWSLSGSIWRTEHDWSMNPDGYTTHLSNEKSLLLERINEIRDKLRDPLIVLSDTLKQDRSAENTAKAIYTFLTSCIDVNELTGDSISSWNAVISALEQLALCGGEEKINDIETLKRLIRLICSQISFSVLPATIDELSVFSLSGFRSVKAKRIYLIGANDGSFPTKSSENSLIDDRLRTALCESGLKLPHDPDEMYLEQMWLFYKAFLSCDESVWISRYTDSLDGKEFSESVALSELKKLYPDIMQKSYKDFCADELIYDKVSAFDYVDDVELGNIAKEILLTDADYRSAIEALDIPISTEACALTTCENLSLFSGDLPLSQTKIETFVKCKFAYQLKYNLKLKEQMKVDYDPRDIGNFVHKVLEEFFREASREKLDESKRKQLVDQIVDRYIMDTCGDMEAVSKRLLSLFERLRRHAHLFVRSIYEEFENSDFEPKFFEMTVSGKADAQLPPYRITLSDGTSVYINGQIDRVDTFEKDGNIYFRIVDYKTGKKEFKQSDLEKGLNLQMFLYLFSIMENKERFCELLGSKGELIPSGVIYYLAKILPSSQQGFIDQVKLEDEVITSISRQGMVLNDKNIIDSMTKNGTDFVLPKGVDIEKGRGPLYTLESLGQMQETINTVVKNIAQAIKRGEADAIPDEYEEPCKWCKLYSVCRRDKEGVVTDNG